MAAEMWDKVKISLLSENGDVDVLLGFYFSSNYNPNRAGTHNQIKLDTFRNPCI